MDIIDIALCKKYASEAKEYRDEAFSGTPEGYEELAEKVSATDFSIDEDGNVEITFTEV